MLLLKPLYVVPSGIPFSADVLHHCFLLRKIYIIFLRFSLLFFKKQTTKQKKPVPNILQCDLHSCSSSSSSCCAPRARWCFFLCTCFLGTWSPPSLHLLPHHLLPLAIPGPADASACFPSQAASGFNGDSSLAWMNPSPLWSRS